MCTTTTSDAYLIVFLGMEISNAAQPSVLALFKVELDISELKRDDLSIDRIDSCIALAMNAEANIDDKLITPLLERFLCVDLKNSDSDPFLSSLLNLLDPVKQNLFGEPTYLFRRYYSVWVELNMLKKDVWTELRYMRGKNKLINSNLDLDKVELQACQLIYDFILDQFAKARRILLKSSRFVYYPELSFFGLQPEFENNTIFELQKSIADRAWNLKEKHASWKTTKSSLHNFWAKGELDFCQIRFPEFQSTWYDSVEEMLALHMVFTSELEEKELHVVSSLRAVDAVYGENMRTESLLSYTVDQAASDSLKKYMSRHLGERKVPLNFKLMPEEAALIDLTDDPIYEPLKHIFEKLISDFCKSLFESGSQMVRAGTSFNEVSWYRNESTKEEFKSYVLKHYFRIGNEYPMRVVYYCIDKQSMQLASFGLHYQAQKDLPSFSEALRTWDMFNLATYDRQSGYTSWIFNNTEVIGVDDLFERLVFLDERASRIGKDFQSMRAYKNEELLEGDSFDDDQEFYERQADYYLNEGDVSWHERMDQEDLDRAFDEDY
jgi:hypothetical protein